MSFYKMYLRQHRGQIAVFLLFCAVFFIVFALYRLPAGAAFYPALICTVLGSGLLAADYRRAYKKHERLKELGKRSAELMEGFFESENWLEEDYREIIEALRTELRSARDAMNRSFADMIDYYTIWVHQIKTPIAALRLYLEGEDSENARRMREELFRIEQYVGMVLAFLRLDSESTDYVFAECDLDDIVRGAVKKFAGQFIRRKLTLIYEPLRLRVVTDEKWLSFCLEQIISNALKYTRSGSVSITLEDGYMLTVRDTGIGIAPEDLPRVFERGYTGYHGREDKKASGIGLFLCRRICENLGHPITLMSEPGVGTAVRIDLEQKRP
ncbi:MAG: HAMP domain-containing histidine kinase, partial [Lachnospiraceae bacterium]|nr:HAMP domain-containing histidine kinase [Lachnospiraceae bacterium]